MSRSQRRISADDFAIGSSRQPTVSRFDDKVFAKYQLDKVTSKDIIQHTCLTWLSDGSALVAGGSDGSIQAFSLDKIAATWGVDASAHCGVTHVAANPQRPSLITAAFRDPKRPEDSTLRNYDVRSKLTHNPKLYTRTHGDLLAIAFHPDGTRLLAVQRSGRITLYDMRKTMRKEGGQAVAVAERPLSYDINDARFTPDGTAIIAAFGTTVGNATVGGLCILSAEDLSDVAEHRAHAAPAISLSQAAPRGRRHVVALGGNDGVATLWDVRSMAVARPLPIADRPVRRVDLSADGGMLAVAGTRESKAGLHDGVDIALVDHGDFFGRTSIHRVDLGPMLLKDLRWSPRQAALALCGDVIDGYQRSSKDVSYTSTVWVYHPRAS